MILGNMKTTTEMFVDKEIKDKKAQAQAGKMNTKEKEYRKLQVSLNVQGLAAAGRAGLAKEIMGVVATKTGVAYNNEEDKVLKTGGWKMVKDAKDQWIGKIEIQAESAGDIQKIFQTIHGGGIEIDGVCLVVEVEPNFVKNERLSPLA